MDELGAPSRANTSQSPLVPAHISSSAKELHASTSPDSVLQFPIEQLERLPSTNAKHYAKRDVVRFLDRSFQENQNGSLSIAKASTRKARKRVKFADEVGNRLKEVHVVSVIEKLSSRAVILILSPSEKMFEFLNVEYPLDAYTTVKDLLEQLPLMTTNAVFHDKTFIGLTKLKKNAQFGLLKLLKDCHFDEGELVLAISEGYTVPQMVAFAVPLMRHGDISKAVRLAKRSGRSLHTLISGRDWLKFGDTSEIEHHRPKRETTRQEGETRKTQLSDGGKPGYLDEVHTSKVTWIGDKECQDAQQAISQGETEKTLRTDIGKTRDVGFVHRMVTRMNAGKQAAPEKEENSPIGCLPSDDSSGQEKDDKIATPRAHKHTSSPLKGAPPKVAQPKDTDGQKQLDLSQMVRQIDTIVAFKPATTNEAHAARPKTENDVDSAKREQSSKCPPIDSSGQENDTKASNVNQERPSPPLKVAHWKGADEQCLLELDQNGRQVHTFVSGKLTKTTEDQTGTDHGTSTAVVNTTNSPVQSKKWRSKLSPRSGKKVWSGSSTSTACGEKRQLLCEGNTTVKHSGAAKATQSTTVTANIVNTTSATGLETPFNKKLSKTNHGVAAYPFDENQSHPSVPKLTSNSQRKRAAADNVGKQTNTHTSKVATRAASWLEVASKNTTKQGVAAASPMKTKHSLPKSPNLKNESRRKTGVVDDVVQTSDVAARAMFWLDVASTNKVTTTQQGIAANPKDAKLDLAANPKDAKLDLGSGSKLSSKSQVDVLQKTDRPIDSTQNRNVSMSAVNSGAGSARVSSTVAAAKDPVAADTINRHQSHPSFPKQTHEARNSDNTNSPTSPSTLNTGWRSKISPHSTSSKKWWGSKNGPSTSCPEEQHLAEGDVSHKHTGDKQQRLTSGTVQSKNSVVGDGVNVRRIRTITRGVVMDIMRTEHGSGTEDGATSSRPSEHDISSIVHLDESLTVESGEQNRSTVSVYVGSMPMSDLFFSEEEEQDWDPLGPQSFIEGSNLSERVTGCFHTMAATVGLFVPTYWLTKEGTNRSAPTC